MYVSINSSKKRIESSAILSTPQPPSACPNDHLVETHRPSIEVQDTPNTISEFQKNPGPEYRPQIECSSSEDTRKTDHRNRHLTETMRPLMEVPWGLGDLEPKASGHRRLLDQLVRRMQGALEKGGSLEVRRSPFERWVP